MKRFWLILLGMAAILAWASPASAALVFTLDQGSCCGTAPFGTVTLSQVTSQEVKVTVALDTGDKFVYTGNGITHQALDFSIAGDPTISITNLSSGFKVGPAPATAAGFGSFNYSVLCPGCGPGASKAKPGPLTFDVSVSSGTLSINSFIANTLGYYFVSDIIGCNGKTGNVGAGGSGVVVTSLPEPASLYVFGAATIGGAWLTRRRLKKRT